MKESEGLQNFAQCALSPESDAAASEVKVRPENWCVTLCYIWCLTLCYRGRTTAGIAACNHADFKPAVTSELALKYKTVKVHKVTLTWSF